MVPVPKDIANDASQFAQHAQTAFCLRDAKVALTEAHIPLTSISPDSIRESAERSKQALEKMNDILSKRSDSEIAQILMLANMRMRDGTVRFGYLGDSVAVQTGKWSVNKLSTPGLVEKLIRNAKPE